MLMCKERVTLVQHIQQPDGDRYTCVCVEGVSWHAKTVVASLETGPRTANVLQCRIPADAIPEEVIPHTGDYLVRGEVSAVACVPRDLEKMEYFKVTAVGDNRRGKLQHWEVTGA